MAKVQTQHGLKVHGDMTMLDDADRRILRAIQTNPDLTMRELGEATGLSHTPCWRRLQKMKDDAVIGEKQYVLRPEALGFEVNVFCHVRMKEHSRDKLLDFEAAVRRVPQVMQCYSITGDHDYILRVLARSIRDYEETIKSTLVSLPHVAAISTSVTLKEVKNTMVVPV
jgi:Lrp/AsnC family transcriptional regulator